MADKIEEGVVADIYVEAPKSEGDVTHESLSKVTALTQTIESRERDIQFVRTWYSPSKVVKKKAVAEVSSQPSVAQAAVVQENSGEDRSEKLLHEDSSDSDSDSEYLPGDEASSGEDDEVAEIFNKFKQFKTKLKSDVPANLDDVVLDRPKEVSGMYEIEMMAMQLLMRIVLVKKIL
jgi:alpha-galactosidase